MYSRLNKKHKWIRKIKINKIRNNINLSELKWNKSSILQFKLEPKGKKKCVCFFLLVSVSFVLFLINEAGKNYVRIQHHLRKTLQLLNNNSNDHSLAILFITRSFRKNKNTPAFNKSGRHPNLRPKLFINSLRGKNVIIILQCNHVHVRITVVMAVMRILHNIIIIIIVIMTTMTWGSVNSEINGVPALSD